MVALEEATNSVDRALNATVQGIFERKEQNASVTPADLVRIFRYNENSILLTYKQTKIFGIDKLIHKMTFNSICGF